MFEHKESKGKYATSTKIWKDTDWVLPLMGPQRKMTMKSSLRLRKHGIMLSNVITTLAMPKNVIQALVGFLKQTRTTLIFGGGGGWHEHKVGEEGKSDL